MRKINFIDLFCGIGGFRSALESVHAECVFSSDMDPHAQEIYQKNWGEKPKGDITQIDARDIPEHDLLCAGFPCQAFSISGNRGGFSDARGTMLYEILRIVSHHNPGILLLENVKNYLTHDNGRTLKTTIQLLEDSGYRVFYSLLNSSRYGVPQKRERVYFVCFRKDKIVIDFQFPEPTDEDFVLEDILLPNNDSRLKELFIERSDLKLKKDFPSERQNRPLRIGTVGKGGQGERVYSPKGHAITLSAFGGGIGAKTGMYMIDDKIRRLHPVECARIMGFADDFQLHDRPNVSYKQFGNSVAVPVVKKIVTSILKSIQAGNQLAA